MSPSVVEGLYSLLPAFYRKRDAEEGLPLRALLALLEEPLRAIERDIQQLHDNSFIETCADWVVPYIGDLLGVRILHAQAGEGLTLRSFVANTIAFRRRKGTPGLLERVAQDITGWPAAAVEYFRLLATTQNVNHVRPAARATFDVRDRTAVEAIGGPFETVPHNVDVRSIASGRGRYNIRNVGIFLWTLRSLKAERVAAQPATDVPPTSPPSPLTGFYRFSPLGQDTALWSPRNTSERIDLRQSPEQVPAPLSRFGLFRRFNALRAGTGDPGDNTALPALFQIFLDGVVVDPRNVVICNLTSWHRPAALPPSPTSPAGPTVAVDPVLGRIALAAPASPNVTVTFYYGAPAEVGGGTYLRQPSDDSITGSPPAIVTPLTGGGPVDQTSVTVAINAWDTAYGPNPPVPKRVVIEIGDSLSYTLGSFTLPDGVHLQIRAARSGPSRPLLVAPSASAVAVTLQGGDTQLTLEGLWMAARIQLTAADSAKLVVAHCTLVPGTSLAPAPGPSPPSPTSPPAPPVLPPAAPGQPSLQLMVDSNVTIIVRESILGPLLASPVTGSVQILDSIIDGTSVGSAAPALRVGTLTISRSTVLGVTTARDVVRAEDSIFRGPLMVERIQDGCPRFCFLPAGSVTPRPFRCQPQMALAALRTTFAARGLTPGAADVSAELARVAPRFLSQTFGDPDYGRLSAACPDEIATGGENESEMGAFSTLQIPMRLSNLQASLDEYLRFGLEVGAFPAVSSRRTP